MFGLCWKKFPAKVVSSTAKKTLKEDNGRVDLVSKLTQKLGLTGKATPQKILKAGLGAFKVWRKLWKSLWLGVQLKSLRKNSYLLTRPFIKSSSLRLDKKPSGRGEGGGVWVKNTSPPPQKTRGGGREGEKRDGRVGGGGP